ncbi:hypothetical protein LRHP344_01278 [Lacticaseibacillus rhamnosus]|uniref:hypothetical protein n=1 Tax=Lacticaseibacillus rhamnosus TaxID=47715 RepID=UPI00115AE722|nr:hypothetical protein [Lacticaseibacillus rhamnosus]VTZ93141.1 hypothetical protein LRHP344_01278 [Lacticaseibacillus rhamnosus]
MKLRGSVLVNTIILFGIFLTMTIGMFKQFNRWQQHYQIIKQVEKSQFKSAYSQWRQNAEGVNHHDKSETADSASLKFSQASEVSVSPTRSMPVVEKTVSETDTKSVP